MSDVEDTTEAAVSTDHQEEDSLEFGVNTNLSIKASSGGVTPSLQELIEAELNARLLQPDSLEPSASPAHQSLLSCDSIEPVTSNQSGPALSLDSLTAYDTMSDPKDPLAQVDQESGIDVLSPTKTDALSNPDSLDSSPDLFISPDSCPTQSSVTFSKGIPTLVEAPIPNLPGPPKDDFVIGAHKMDAETWMSAEPDISSDSLIGITGNEYGCESQSESSRIDEEGCIVSDTSSSRDISQEDITARTAVGVDTSTSSSRNISQYEVFHVTLDPDSSTSSDRNGSQDDMSYIDADSTSSSSNRNISQDENYVDQDADIITPVCTIIIHKEISIDPDPDSNSIVSSSNDVSHEEISHIEPDLDPDPDTSVFSSKNVSHEDVSLLEADANSSTSSGSKHVSRQDDISEPMPNPDLPKQDFSRGYSVFRNASDPDASSSSSREVSQHVARLASTEVEDIDTSASYSRDDVLSRSTSDDDQEPADIQTCGESEMGLIDSQSSADLLDEPQSPLMMSEGRFSLNVKQFDSNDQASNFDADKNSPTSGSLDQVSFTSESFIEESLGAPGSPDQAEVTPVPNDKATIAFEFIEQGPPTPEEVGEDPGFASFPNASLPVSQGSDSPHDPRIATLSDTDSQTSSARMMNTSFDPSLENSNSPQISNTQYSPSSPQAADVFFEDNSKFQACFSSPVMSEDLDSPKDSDSPQIPSSAENLNVSQDHFLSGSTTGSSHTPSIYEDLISSNDDNLFVESSSSPPLTPYPHVKTSPDTPSPSVTNNNVVSAAAADQSSNPNDSDDEGCGGDGDVNTPITTTFAAAGDDNITADDDESAALAVSGAGSGGRVDVLPGSQIDMEVEEDLSAGEDDIDIRYDFKSHHIITKVEDVEEEEEEKEYHLERQKFQEDEEEEEKEQEQEQEPEREETLSIRQEESAVNGRDVDMATTENGVDTTEKKKKKKKRGEDGDKKSKKKKKKKGESDSKASSSSCSSGDTDTEEEEDPCPTPPLYNGHAVTNGLRNHQPDEDLISEQEFHSDHELLTKENFNSLRDIYNSSSAPRKENRAQTPLSDEEDLAGVSVKQLKLSYLSVAQQKQQRQQLADKSDLNTSINIHNLVDTYSSPPPKSPPTSSRPDDLTPVSLRSLKSAYEATATRAAVSCATSGAGSCDSGSPVSNSPAPKEELNISLHQLREEYCKLTQDGLTKADTFSKTTLDTGVSIRQLAVQVSSDCKQCGKQVFQMEKIVAEKASWHKNCFRCSECSCILTLETYQSHEGVLYCKSHFKQLFQPKAVIEDPDQARKERPTNTPDYGLEDLSTANIKKKFEMFEAATQEEDTRPEPIPIRRSQSLLNKAAKFMYDDDEEYGIENSEIGDFEDYEEDEEEEEEDEDNEDGENDDPDAVKTKKKQPTEKDIWAQKHRREEMTKKRKEEVAKFRQMLCAGKNITTREMFESGNFEDSDKSDRKEQIKIEGRLAAAKNLRDKFEKGEINANDVSRKEVEDILRDSETSSKARNMFKEIDSQLQDGSTPVMRSRSLADARREKRLSMDGIDVEEQEVGRDPNYIKCTDNFEDKLDCRSTRNVLAMFKKMEMQQDEEERGRAPRPLKRFTPPPEGEGDEEDSDDEEYTDEEYSDEEDDDDEDEDEEEEEEDDEQRRIPKYKDEVLEMVQSSQSARKAASLRAKFEKWETEVERNNEYNQGERQEGEEECMPSIDTARNLRAMFENKAQEASRPQDRPKVKVNRFKGGGGDKCIGCDQTVYAMERLEVAGRVLHKNCFKCCKCNTKLNLNSFSIGGNDVYCMAHYKQAFTQKGTYDVFSPTKGNWTKKIEAINPETPKSQE